MATIKGLLGLRQAQELAQKKEEATSLHIDGVMTVEGNSLVCRWPLNAMPDIDALPVNEKEIKDEKTGIVTRKYHSGNICFKAEMPKGLEFTFPNRAEGGTVILPASRGGSYGTAKMINIGVNIAGARFETPAEGQA